MTDHVTEGQRDEVAAAIGTARRWMSVGSGVSMIFAALVGGALLWLPLHFLADIVADPPYPRSEIPPLVVMCVAYRASVPLLAIPTLICGILLVRARRRSWLLLIVGMLGMLVPLALVLYCFVGIIGPMYEMHPI